MKYHFSASSKQRLRGVLPDLVGLCYRALFLSPYDFGITEGLRDRATQARMVEEGKSQTMNSRHLTGHAIDFAIWLDGEYNWDFEKYKQVAHCFYQAANEYDIPITWGGDWDRDGDSSDHSLLDGPHIQLQWDHYPV